VVRIVSAGEPAPTPTPSPRSLSALADQITLDRSAAGTSQTDGSIVISNDNLSELASHGVLTTCVGASRARRGGSKTTATREATAGRSGGESQRQRWRQRYRKQAETIAELKDKRELLEAQIEHLQSHDRKRRSSSRLAQLRAKLELLEEQIEREEMRLHGIVREARQHGAQPGWFRDLR
jgi:hypothetical protein